MSRKEVEMKVKIITEISYDSEYDFSAYEDEMKEHALSHISEMQEEDYTSGELNYFEPNNSVEIRGWWSVKEVME